VQFFCCLGIEIGNGQPVGVGIAHGFPLLLTIIGGVAVVRAAAILLLRIRLPILVIAPATSRIAFTPVIAPIVVNATALLLPLALPVLRMRHCRGSIRVRTMFD
jgi:hypothetical protein